MKVLDMEASAGYSTELLARTVGPTGAVYAQDVGRRCRTLRQGQVRHPRAKAGP